MFDCIYTITMGGPVFNLNLKKIINNDPIGQFPYNCSYIQHIGLTLKPR